MKLRQGEMEETLLEGTSIKLGALPSADGLLQRLEVLGTCTVTSQPWQVRVMHSTLPNHDKACFRS